MPQRHRLATPASGDPAAARSPTRAGATRWAGRPAPRPPQPGGPTGAHLLLGGVAHPAEPAGRGVPLQRRAGDAVTGVVGARRPLHLPQGHGSARPAAPAAPSRRRSPRRRLTGSPRYTAQAAAMAATAEPPRGPVYRGRSRHRAQGWAARRGRGAVLLAAGSGGAGGRTAGRGLTRS